MGIVSFAKYEGTGNDFVLIEDDSPSVVDGSRARQLCDRHFGIGADGVLLVTPPSSDAARARMTILNADGSRAEMCGNGLRCVALHLARQDSASDCQYCVQTDVGVLACEVERDGDTANVKIRLGQGQPGGEYVSQFDGSEYRFSRISMGNPHAVAFDAALDEAAIDRFGLQVSGALPGGSNVEFAAMHGARTIDLVVWERGVGRTLACGTGAAATVVAAALSGRAPFDQSVQVRLPGGVLHITVAQASLVVHLRGPARRVFTGEVADW